jgi:hypothetical protein
MKCNSCRQDFASCFVYNKNTSSPVYLCAECKKKKLTQCNGNCQTLLMVDGIDVVAKKNGYNTRTTPTVFLCTNCDTKQKTWCDGRCQTLLMVDQTTVKECFPLPATSSSKAIKLCGTCYNNRCECDGNCDTVLLIKGKVKIDDKLINHYNNPKNQIANQYMQDVKLCDTCNNNDKKIWCYGKCNRILRVGGNPVATAYRPYSPNMSFCLECENGAERCTLCGAPAAKDGQGFPLTGYVGKDRRHRSQYRCAYCFSCRVDSSAETAAYNQVYEWIVARPYLNKFTKPAHWVIMTDRLEEAYNNSLEERIQIKNSENPSNVDLFGFCLGEPQSDGTYKNTIYIEKFLPRAWFAATAAHELTHAWHYAQGLKMRPSQGTKEWISYKQVLEGFAQWMAYQYLQDLIKQGGLWKDEAPIVMEAIAASKDEIYGVGFQLFTTSEKSGVGAVMDLARSIVLGKNPVKV